MIIKEARPLVTYALALIAAAALTVLVSGCTADTPHYDAEPLVEAPCGPNDGLEVVEGEIVRGITQCALCARFAAAYDLRAAELGCAAPFPAEACGGEGLADCYVELIDDWAHFDFSRTCEQLHAYASNPSTYHGFVCGDSCMVTGFPDRQECCPGTPYAFRGAHRCPYWCEGVSQCNADPECIDLYESL